MTPLSSTMRPLRGLVTALADSLKFPKSKLRPGFRSENTVRSSAKPRFRNNSQVETGGTDEMETVSLLLAPLLPRETLGAHLLRVIHSQFVMRRITRVVR